MYNCVQFPQISSTLYFLRWKICYIDVKSCFKVITCISLNPSKAIHFPHLVYFPYFCVWFAFLLLPPIVESGFWNSFHFCWTIQIAPIQILVSVLPTCYTPILYRFYQNCLKHDSELPCSKTSIIPHWLAFKSSPLLLLSSHDLYLTWLSKINSYNSLSNATLCIIINPQLFLKYNFSFPASVSCFPSFSLREMSFHFTSFCPDTTYLLRPNSRAIMSMILSQMVFLFLNLTGRSPKRPLLPQNSHNISIRSSLIALKSSDTVLQIYMYIASPKLDCKYIEGRIHVYFILLSPIAPGTMLYP